MNNDIQFLKELQSKLNTQEHDYQAHPRFWVIMDYRIVPANEDYDSGFIQYFHNDGEHTVFKTFGDLKGFLEEYYEDDIEKDEELQELLKSEDINELWEYVEDNLNDDGFFSKVFVKEEAYIKEDTMFLTKEEAKAHLESNYYHYTKKAHTYAMTAWRSPEVEILMNILMKFDWDKVDFKE